MWPVTSPKDYNSWIQSAFVCLDFTWTQLGNAKKYAATAEYFTGSAMTETQSTAMAVLQFVKLSPITSVSTAHRHINLTVPTMAVTSASLWSGSTRPMDRIRECLPLLSILHYYHSTDLILWLICIFSVISRANLLDGLTIMACFSSTSTTSKIYKKIQLKLL